MNQTVLQYLLLLLFAWRFDCEQSLPFSIQPLWLQLKISSISIQNESLLPLLLQKQTPKCQFNPAVLNLLQCSRYCNKSKSLYHDNTRSLTFLNSCELPHLFKGEGFCEKWRWYKRMEGLMEGDEDHLRQRISYVGLGKDNRGVMRIVIDISRNSCYIT